jgi:tetratricopeptide (TPR) repeat protein
MVPGNHDLIRPSKLDPTAAALRSWWQNPDVRDGFWSTLPNTYIDFVTTAFSNYSNFQRRLKANGFPICDMVNGILPGDGSTVIECNGLRLGIVGLNSAYLQLFDADGPKLDVDVRQLLAVTENDPDKWCEKNHINLLVTHHPTSWLDGTAANNFLGEIYLPRRFTAHLFGHMHEPDIQSLSFGGSHERKSIQAASLYGLRKYGPGKIDRIHGYSGARLDIGDGEGRLIFWPRIDKVVTSGARRFTADTRFDLSETNTFELSLGKIDDLSGVTALEIVAPIKTFGNAQQEAAATTQTSVISLNRQPPRSAAQHLHVRRLEQGKLISALEKGRVAWLAADWGYGAEEFISTALMTLSSPPSETFRIDLHDYTDRDGFLSRFLAQTGRSFQEFCKSISGAERALLMLEDAPVSRATTPDSENWEKEIETIVEAIGEYCQNALVILISRQSPSRTTIPTIEIRPLDEPDLRTYLLNHPLGGTERAGPNEIADILTLTGGLPVEIDSTLKDLEFISLSELLSLRLNSPPPTSSNEGYVGLSPVIESLKNSSEAELLRAFDLLVALSAFPYGETLTRIRRFDPDSSFYPSQAAILSDRGLIESVATTPALSRSTYGQAQSPKLVAKKIIIERIESLLTPDQINQRNHRAATIYFGEKWNLGQAKSLRTADLSKALGGDGGLGNPQSIINSLLRTAVEEQDVALLNKSVQLARLFVANIGSGDRYRSSVAACQDFLRIIPETDEYTQDRNWLKYNLAICLRMLGRHAPAIELFNELEDVKFEKRTRQRLLLNWALAIQRTEPEKARKMAKKLIDLGKGTFQAMHAQALVLQLSPEEPDRLQKLKSLEIRARGKKSISVANSIAYFIAKQGEGNPDERRTKLRMIAASAKKNGDPYSAAQAIVGIGDIDKTRPVALTRDEVSGLVEAYHYLYNERIGSLFRRCHATLWRHFLEIKDVENLLRLFRQSSFIWRIYGDDSLEKPYIDQLSTMVAGDEGKWLQLQSTESAYFILRAERVRASIR